MQQLLKEHAALEKSNQHLEKELETNKEQLSHQLKSVETLKQQVSVLKLNSGEMNDADKKEIEKRINTYIKEIDRCISLLGK